MLAQTLRCEWCSHPAHVGEVGCRHCGGPVRLLEPWVLECGWCDASNRRDETPVCTRCGGYLPTIPGGHPGPRPPDPSRALPPGYANRIMYWKNVYVILGMTFTICFCWTVIFPIIGIFAWRRGHRTANNRLTALAHGIPTRGRILRVTEDTTQHINHRHPWAIEVEYDTPYGARRGVVEAWDPAHARRPPGEHVWIVFVPGQEDQFAIWPPIR